MKNSSKNNYLVLLVSFVVTALLGPSAYAQDKTPEIDKIFSWATPTTPGCVVAASHHGKLVVNRAYGLADLERDVPLSTDSIFDAGSVRKQFVAAAVLLLVEEGRLSLSDDVHKHIPRLPDYGHKITLDHLLTHTSGLRDWTALLNLAGGDPDAMSMILRQRELNFAPGEEWSYSNSGYVLLPEIVARTSGMSFAEFARKRLFEPLGMKATTYVDDARTVVKNRALAYEKEGNRWRMDMLLGNDRDGAGALFTTANDLVIWTEALANNRLGAFVSEKLQEPATLNNGRRLSYARGFLSTPSDLVRFAMAIDSGKLLQPATVQLLQSPQRLTSGEETGYGLGWDLETVEFMGKQTGLVGHDGESLGGMVASLMMFREYGIVVSVTSNISYADTFSIAVKIAQAFADQGRRSARK